MHAQDVGKLWIIAVDKNGKEDSRPTTARGWSLHGFLVLGRLAGENDKRVERTVFRKGPTERVVRPSAPFTNDKRNYSLPQLYQTWVH